ncbi:MAG: hypothetical protein H6502_02395 [Candidatus Woesearchaeota archaeon]|nr:MAG: hypothetical protein H6502_02395 [Candidatus Woesearchaeota archaeon]
MVKNHLKAKNTPRTWSLPRKAEVFVLKPLPGPHTKEFGMPLGVAFKQLLALTSSNRESRFIVQKKGLLVNGTARKDLKFPVGFMDVLSFTSAKEHYRLIITQKNKLAAVKVDEKEATSILARIQSKKRHGKDQFQIGLFGGRTLITKEAYAVGDTLQLEVPSQKVIARFPLAPKHAALIMRGRHAGTVVRITSFDGDDAAVHNILDENDAFTTLKSYLYVLGNDLPAVTVTEKPLNGKKPVAKNTDKQETEVKAPAKEKEPVKKQAKEKPSEKKSVEDKKSTTKEEVHKEPSSQES